ncbi:MAG: amidohydrolase family protein [Planctomycetaceae bacterium]
MTFPSAESSQCNILTARWVLPVDGPPLERGVVEIEGGLITALHSKPPGPNAVDLGSVALIPGLVNAHTHLELSDVDAPLPFAGSFTDWLGSVIEHRRARAAGATATPATTPAVIRGCRECLAQGTTLVADIVSPEWNPATVAETSLPVVALLECLGLSAERILEQVRAALNHLRQAESGSEPGVQRGLSPHAPYSVHPDLLSALVDIAVSHEAPVAIHLAETEAERDLLAGGRGPFVEFLKSIGAWRDGVFRGGLRFADYLRELARAPWGLVIHGNYLAGEDLDLLAGCPHLSVVYCPRTHARFGHAPHPWQTLLSRGIAVALGTDSRASNPDLSLWRELQFLHERHPEFPPHRLLELGTREGARALNTENTRGTLTPGKRADLAVVALPAHPAADPYDLLFHSTARISATMVGGGKSVPQDAP